MKKNRIIICVLAAVMMFGGTLTVNAAAPRNNWCCPGAADKIAWEGEHTCPGSGVLHVVRMWECNACGNYSKYICAYGSSSVPWTK